MNVDEVNYDLVLTPTGHLLLREAEGSGDLDAWMKRAVAAFSSSQAAGLFSLAATRPDTPPSPSFSFWRDFACRYLTELCRTPEFTGDSLDPIDPPILAEIAPTLHVDARRERFLEVARTLLLEEGYETVTITRVAEETGFSRGTVYQLFNTDFSASG